MASRGKNLVILIGNCGKAPEAKNFSNGGSLTNVTLATTESWKDKEGQQQERTEWHNVVFHNKLGEIAAKYLQKGSKVYVQGSIRTRKWKDKDGNDRYSTEIHADEMQMLDGKRSDGDSGQSYSRESSQSRDSGEAPSHAGAGHAGGGLDDDIPFFKLGRREALSI